jgi:hypothetical protein
MMQYYRDRTKQASSLIEKVGNEKTVKEANKAFKERKALGDENNFNRLTDEREDNEL